jgi:cytidylate kinase
MKLIEQTFTEREDRACNVIIDVRQQFLGVYPWQIIVGLDGGMATGKGVQARIHRESGFLIASSGGFYRACAWLCCYLNIFDAEKISHSLHEIAQQRAQGNDTGAAELHAELKAYIYSKEELMIHLIQDVQLDLVTNDNTEQVVVKHPFLGAQQFALDAKGVLRQPHVEEVTKILSGLQRVTSVVDLQIRSLAQRTHRFFGEGRDKRANLAGLENTWIGYTAVTPKVRNQREVQRRKEQLGVRNLSRAEEHAAIMQAQARDESDMSPQRKFGRLLPRDEAIKSGQYDGFIDTTKFTPCEVALITYWFLANHFVPNSPFSLSIMREIENTYVTSSKRSVLKLQRKYNPVYAGAD